MAVLLRCIRCRRNSPCLRDRLGCTLAEYAGQPYRAQGSRSGGRHAGGKQVYEAARAAGLPGQDMAAFIAAGYFSQRNTVKCAHGKAECPASLP